MTRWNLVQYLIHTYQLEGMPAHLVIIGGFLACMIIPYLLGSLNFGLIISRNRYHDDIRAHGSGNAGATNMLRTYGKKAAIFTMAGDMLKAVVAVLIGYIVLNFDHQILNEAGEVTGIHRDPIGGAIAGLFVMLGHMFPCFFKFKGGKGVATAGMVVLMISPLTFLACFTVFIIIVVGTKFVSLGSIMAFCLYPILLGVFLPDAPWAHMMSVVMATAVVVKHKDNIKRLLDGKESKISLGKKKNTEEAEVPKPEPTTEPTPEKDYAFVTCVGCGRTIPVTRQKCAYCKAKNPHYTPDGDK